MGDKHEEFLAEVLHGRQTRGSGNQWRDQMDGRNNRYEGMFSWAWDGKSTLAKSISITRDMWKKAKEQASGDRPLIALRFYDDERLVGFEDLVVISMDDFRELIDLMAAVEAACEDEPS